MQFTISPETEAKRLAIRNFVNERLIPLERDRAAVETDLRNGLISAEHAEKHYGFKAA